MEPAPEETVVVNTYKRPLLLSRCLEALSRQKETDRTEVLVVDDGGEADLKAIERLWRTKLDLRFIKIRHAGRSAARNRGAKAAKGRRLVFLGDDVIVRPGWLAAHRSAGAGGRLLAAAGPYPLENPERHPPALRTWADSVHLQRIPDPANAGFRFFVTGNLSMDREMFLELGGFDERFRHYGWEDIDLGLRFERAGGRLVFLPAAKAVHAHPTVTRRDLWRREYESGITAWQFQEKWRDPALADLKWWSGLPVSGPAWRRTAGDRLIGWLERLNPASPRLPALYERMVYSWRLAGAAEGRRLYGERGAAADSPAGESNAG